MEGFEHVVAVALEAEGFAVSSSVKFRVKRAARKGTKNQHQTHGYEVDLVGARGDRLVLATVKSFFGSRGVAVEHVMGGGTRPGHRRLYQLLHDCELRDQVVQAAAEYYGYAASQVELRLYAGKFAGSKKGTHKGQIQEWCARQLVGGGPIRVYGAEDVARAVLALCEHKQYRDHPVIATVRALQAAGLLSLDLRFPSEHAAGLEQ